MHVRRTPPHLRVQFLTTAGQPHTPKSLFVWAALFVGALAIRFLYLQDIASLTDFNFPAVDAAYHDYWAWSLVSGEWGTPGGQITSESPGIEAHPFFRPPGYAYALAAIYTVFGHSFEAARWVQFALGALSAVLAAELGRKTVGIRAGFIAGVIVATHWVPIYFEGELQPPAVATPLVLAAFLACLHGGRIGAAFAGLWVGLAGLVVPNALILAPVIAGWFVYKERRDLGAVVVAVALLSLGPSTVRNYSVSGEIVPISTNFGINLHAGNNPNATGHDVDLAHFGTSFDHLRMVRIAEEEAGTPLTHVQASRHWASHAISHAVRNPVATLGLTLRKAWMFWADREIFSNKELNTARRESSVLYWSPWRWSLLLGLGGVGLVASGRKRPAVLLLLAGVVVFSLSYLPFFVTARYRAPLIPVMAVLAALGIDELQDWDWTRLRIPIAAGVALFGLSQIDLATPINPGHWHYMLGVTHARKGEPAAAQKRLSQAIYADPEYWSARHERARLVKNTDRELAHEDLRLAHAGLPANSAIALDYAVGLRRAGRLVEATEVYREALVHSPDHSLLRNNLALTLSSRGDPIGAIQEMKLAVAADPDFGQGWINLGNFCGQAGRYDEAAVAFKEAARLDAQGGRQNWAQALSYAGHHAEALQIYRVIVHDERRSGQALMQLAEALERADLHSQALEIWREAYVAAPYDPSIRAFRLLSVMAAGDADTAFEIVETALAQAPEDPYMSVQYALLLSSHPDPRKRDGPRALTLIEGFIDKLDARAEAHEAHACALAEVGRRREAKAARAEAITLGGEDSRPFPCRLLP